MMPSDEAAPLAAHPADGAAESTARSAAADALRNGPAGALAVASIAVALLLAGWLAFYFLLFMARGPSG